MNATVSVLLTTHGSRWTRTAIESVLGQTFSGYELLVLDDRPDPDTKRYVEELQDPRVRYLPSPRPLGPARNHRRGLQAAAGPLVSIINHDDRWRPHLLSTLVPELLREPRATVAFSDHTCIDHEGRELLNAAEFLSHQWGRDLLLPGLHIPFRCLAAQGTLPIAQSAVWRRSAVESIPSWAYGSYDTWIALQLSKAGGGAIFVPARLAEWRVHDDALTSRVSVRKDFGNFLLWRSICEDEDFLSERRLAASRYKSSRRALAAAMVKAAIGESATTMARKAFGGRK